MTQPPPTGDPAFRGQGSELHDWAMDLTAHSNRIRGLEPTHSVALAIAAIAARIEARAAETQSHRHPRWQAVLYRSAGWLCLKSAEADTSLLDLAQHCLQKARALDSPERSQLSELESAITGTRANTEPPAPPRPLRLCCLCRISLDWSRHTPRPLTAAELTLPGPAGHICSQCEWTLILEETPPAPQPPARINQQIYAALADAGRSSEAKPLSHQTPTETRALLAISRLWIENPNPTPAILTAVTEGKLISFGVWPPGQKPSPRDTT